MKKKSNELPLVEFVMNEDDPNATGVMAISIVKDPAIKEGFTLLSKEYQLKFETMDEEKRIVLGPVLIPNQKIYRRNDDGTEFNGFFTEKTIEKMAHLYLKKGRQANTTIEHAVDVDGTCIVETWIVTNKDKDKSNAYGMNYPEGTWMASMKIDRDDVWNEFLKSGELTGFSIEGLLNGIKVKQSEEGVQYFEVPEDFEKRLMAGMDVFKKMLKDA